ncbi:MAG: hypothetical protein RJA07_2160 [Bacteroidota bacterium]|jgi:hypothetical protein
MLSHFSFRKLFAICLIAIATTSFSACNLLVDKDAFQKILVKTAEDMSKKCPMTVDSETRLDNVTALPDNELLYSYTLVNYAKADLNVKTFEDNMRPVILNAAKTNPDLKIFRDNKTTLTYSYKDKDGIFLTKISATEKDYTSTTK